MESPTSPGRKVSRGFRYYKQDLERIARLKDSRETITDFIETALTHEFERRERAAKMGQLTSLA